MPRSPPIPPSPPMSRASSAAPRPTAAWRAVFGALDAEALIAKLAAADIAFGGQRPASLSRHPHLRRITVETPGGPVSLPAPAEQHRGAARSTERCRRWASIPTRSARSSCRDALNRVRPAALCLAIRPRRIVRPHGQMTAHPILLADIGGTNSRFAIAGASGRPERVIIIENDRSPASKRAITHYLDRPTCSRAPRCWRSRRRWTGDKVTTDQPRLAFPPQDLAAALRLPPAARGQRFRGHRLGAVARSADDVRVLGQPHPRAGRQGGARPRHRAGRRRAGVRPRRSFVVSSEGGHISFGPRREDEIEVFTRLMREHGMISAELVVSGPGLVRLMRALDPGTAPRDARGGRQSRARRRADRQGHRGAVRAAARAVRRRRCADLQGVRRRLYRRRRRLARSARCSMNGRSARRSRRIRRYEHLLKEIPTLLMNRTEPGLLGCAVLADAEAAAAA